MKNKKSKCIAIIFLLLPLISLPVVFAQNCDWTGTWVEGGQIDAPSQMTLQQTGDTVTGTYTHNAGTINGKVEGNKLIGQWSELSNSGKIEFDMSDGCNFFSGKWEERGEWMGPWTGTRQNPTVGSTGELLVQTAAGMTAAKPGGKITLSPGDRIKLGANCTEFVSLVKANMGNDQNFTNAIVALAYIRARGLTYQEPDYDLAGHNWNEDKLHDVLQQALLDLRNCVVTCARLEDENPGLVTGLLAKSASDSSPLLGSSMDQSDSPAQIELGLESGPFLAEVVNDKVSLTLKTDTATVTSSGKNTFGVAYVPSIGTTYVAAYQGSVGIQPTNSNLAPFTLGAGQIVDVSSEEIGPVTPLSQVSGGAEGSTHVSPDGRDIYGPAGEAGNAADQTGLTSEVPLSGCHTDPSTGEMICVDRISDFFNPDAGNQEQGGCYTDPSTGEIICVDALGEVTNPSGSTGTAYTTQPDAGSSAPQSLRECETYTSEICGTWTRMGDQFNAQWDNGASAALNVERWDNGAVVLTRHDTAGSSAGLTARYEGRCTGNHVEGTVTWTWNGSTWSGTWSANW